MAPKMLFLALIIGFLTISQPKTTEASFGDVYNYIVGVFTAPAVDANINTQPTSPLVASAVEAASNIDPTPTKNETDTAVVSDSALLSEAGPDAAAGDANQVTNDQISVYTVHDGDSLSSIAKMFDVSVNTILWANDVTAKTLKTGQVLVILPVSGLKYTVKKGDTIKAIATKYGGDVDEIISFNGLDNNGTLTAGDEIIIPGGQEQATSVSTANSTAKVSSSLKDASGYFILPISRSACHRTQGLHGWNHNAVDYGCPIGTDIHAAAAGTVLISRSSGWNGGYGEYVVIQHPNGTQSVYGHMSKPLVSSGDQVTQGQLIGLSGNSGKVIPAPTKSNPNAGAHLHFELRGSVRNPF
jgi:LysM repeat protein